MIQKVFYGTTSNLTAQAGDIGMNAKLALGILVAIIVVVGVYPTFVLDLTRSTSEFILSKMFYTK